MSLPEYIPATTVKVALSTTDHAPGKSVTLDLRDLQRYARLGERAGHIAGMTISFDLDLATVAASMAEAETTNRALREWVQNFTIEAAKHRYFDNVDGHHLEVYREGIHNNADPFFSGTSSIPDADATLSNVTCAFHVPLAYGADIPEEYRYDRVLPLALFGGDLPAFVTYDLQQQLIAGVSVAAVNSVTLHLDLVYLEYFNVPTAFRAHTWRQQNLVHVIRPEGAVDQLVVINDGTTAANRSHSDYRLTSLTANGEDVLGVREATIADLNAMNRQRGGSEYTAPLSRADRVEIVRPRYHDRRATKMLRGNLRAQFSARPSHFSAEEWFMVDTGLMTDKYARDYLDALGAPPGTPMVSRSRGKREHFLSALIGSRVVFGDRGPEMLRRKFRKG